MAGGKDTGGRTGGWLRRLWRRATLVQRLAVLALVPTALTALLLVALLTRHQHDALRDMAHTSAVAIATEAAAVSTQPLRLRDRRELERISRSIAHLPSVTRVQIRAPDGEILAETRRPVPPDDPAPLTVVRDATAQVDGDGDGDARDVIGSVLVDVSLAEAAAAQHEALVNALLWLVVSLAVAALVSWEQARWISKPLRRLAQAVHQLGSGNRQVSVQVTDDTEIGELQRGFNAAVTALDDVQSDMERRIEESTLELAQKNAALEAASVAKARFLAAATHDLRQPLYALTLFSSTLAADEQDPQRLDSIAHIQECVESLDRLFSELLDLSRLEAGNTQSERSDVALDQVFDEVSRNFRMLAEQHELRLVVRKTDLWVYADRTMLARILNNLVSNALRYTRHGGVLVVARRRGQRVRIDVWDSGHGIAAEHQERVFEEFYRIESPEHEDHGRPGQGLGLGLATVQRLAALLDTRVTLQSRPGVGSVFSLEVPLAAARLRGLPVPRPPQPTLELRGLRVMVVDDEQAILAGIRRLLDNWGCEARVAVDREHALQVAAAWGATPDIVIADLHLDDGASGLDVLAALADFYACDRPATPFARLLITGETRSARLCEALAANVPVLYKPVAPDQLRETIIAACAMAPGATAPVAAHAPPAAPEAFQEPGQGR